MRKQWKPGALFPYLMRLGTRLSVSVLLPYFQSGCDLDVTTDYITSDMHGIMGRAFTKHVAYSRKCDDNKENSACMILVSVCLFCMYMASVPGQL